MKHLYISILGLVAMLLAGCTHNNGDIGDLFGSWVLEEVSIDGAPTTIAEDDETTFSFQANVVRVVLHYSDGYFHLSYLGTWTRHDDTLDFDFTHHNNEVEPGQEGYMAPTWLGFETNAVTHTTITRLDGGHLDFVRTDAEGRTYLYKFLRTW